MNATSRITTATVTIAASAYTERRPESTQSRRPLRAPYSEAPIPYSVTANASASATRPANAIRAPSSSRRGVRRRHVLRRALGDHRVRLGDERAAAQRPGDDQLAPGAERGWHRPRVVDRDRVLRVRPVGEPEVQGAARVRGNRARNDGAGQLHDLPRLRTREQLAGLERRVRGGEARIDQAAGEEHCGDQ